MNGLEAIELMQKGRYVTNGKYVYRFANTKIEGNEIELFNYRKFNWDSGVVFDFNYEGYKECIEPEQPTGWERAELTGYYFVIEDDGVIFDTEEDFDGVDRKRYDVANYFTGATKAKEINFKQTLFRKLQRLSDENGGNEIDWNDVYQTKYGIVYETKANAISIRVCTVQRFGEVYFLSYDAAKEAARLFKDDLIKYFTHDWSEGNE